MQKDGNMAKEYQVKVVVKAIEKLKEDKCKEITKNKTRKADPGENKHGKE